MSSGGDTLSPKGQIFKQSSEVTCSTLQAIKLAQNFSFHRLIIISDSNNITGT